jgi:hypothetical protein
LAESSNKASRNYSAAVKQAPLPAASALRAYKTFTPKVNQDKSFVFKRELYYKLKRLTLD